MIQSEIAIDEAKLEALHVEDVFVLRRVEKDRFVHVGGVGRGEGWAGLTELRLHDSPAAHSAYDENRVVKIASHEERHVFGPYWSQWAAFVPVDHDVMVVFGGPGDEDTPRDSETLQTTAAAAARQIQVVSPAKRLADELEILHAVQHLIATVPESTSAAMQHIVRCATESLSCEFGVAWLKEGDGIATTERGWRPDVSPSHIVQALRGCPHGSAQEPVCIQDATAQSLPTPFLPEEGVCSYYLLPMGEVAMLLLVHTHVAPRGFTQLCQELGRRMAESSEMILRTAIQRENLSREVKRLSGEARCDPLTGLANRLGWEERVEQCIQERSTAPCGVICIDLDDLKGVNDSLGHEAGDRYLQVMADILRENVRPVDFVARLGGDEFAVLLPGTGSESCARVLSRLDAAAAARPGVRDGFPIGFARGFAVCESGSDIRDTVREADAALIRGKREG